MASTFVLPAAMRYQGELASTAVDLDALGRRPDLTALDEVTTGITALTDAIAELRSALDHEMTSATLTEARHAAERILPCMDAVRGAADALEEMVADDLWPLPTYQEMLFIL
jgi:glutamine synthetase